jgi:hypothetical protein
MKIVKVHTRLGDRVQPLADLKAEIVGEGLDCGCFAAA